MKKIAIIGPECTGKSTLCEQLAKHYKTLWCPEFAREYLLMHGKRYDYEDLLLIAKGQVKLEESHISTIQRTLSTSEEKIRNENPHSSLATSHSLLFIDTEMYVMKVWSEYVYGKCDRYILNQAAERKYDLYLLCNTDIPWVADELREYPDLATRQNLFLIYKDIMVNQKTPWVEIGGNNEERLSRAMLAVDSLLKK